MHTPMKGGAYCTKPNGSETNRIESAIAGVFKTSSSKRKRREQFPRPGLANFKTEEGHIIR